ncbi:hypothetical protein GCM10027280_21210 [Micromonospora polyrhachis]
MKGLLIPASYLVFGLPGLVLLLISLTRAIAAIDVASWSVSQAGLLGARHWSWAAGTFFAANVFALPLALLLGAELSLALLLTLPLAFVLLMLLAVAGCYGYYYQRLARWHREAPPEALRPTKVGGGTWGPGQVVFPPDQQPPAEHRPSVGPPSGG